MGKRHILSLSAFIICALAFVITFVTNRNNTGFENVTTQPTAILPLLKVKTDGVLLDNLAVSGEQSINIGSTVKTDATGSAEIDFPTGSVTRIAPNSDIVLQEFHVDSNSASIKVTIGKIWSRVAKVFGKESFQTESNNLIASVRGTSYGHEVTADGHDIVIVTKSTVECDCKEKKPWQRFIEAGNGVNYDCVKNDAPAIFKLTAKDKSDEWYKFNEEEDAKLNDPWPSPTPTTKPIFTVKPTTKPTSTPTPQPTVAPTTTPSSSPSPTPTPSLTITSIDSTNCKQNGCTLLIYGSGFSANSLTTVVDVNGKQFGPASVRSFTTTMLNVYFSSLSVGTYFINVTQGSQTVTSPTSVLVQ